MKYLPFLLLLIACSPAWHLQKAKKHELIAISKGAKINRDTVYVSKTVYVPVPPKKDSVSLDPVEDLKTFDESMSLNDSLVVVIHDGKTAINNGVVIDEKALRALSKANAELTALKKKMAKGFLMDSVYSFYPDSLTSVDVIIKEQKISVHHARKEYKVKKDMTVPVSIDQTIKAGFTTWNLVSIGISALVVGLILGYLARSMSK